MDLDHLKQILDLVATTICRNSEIEHDGLRLKIRKGAAGPRSSIPFRRRPRRPSPPPVVHSAPAGPTPSASVSVAGSESNEEVELAVVKSPIVGTFYRSPEPEAPPFVEIGATVKKGQVLCIIEAMKLMNEIDSEYDGEVVNVYVENGQPVQYGERLFAIRTS